MKPFYYILICCLIRMSLTGYSQLSVDTLTSGADSNNVELSSEEIVKLKKRQHLHPVLYITIGIIALPIMAIDYLLNPQSVNPEPRKPNQEE